MLKIHYCSYQIKIQNCRPRLFHDFPNVIHTRTLRVLKRDLLFAFAASSSLKWIDVYVNAALSVALAKILGSFFRLPFSSFSKQGFIRLRSIGPTLSELSEFCSCSSTISRTFSLFSMLKYVLHQHKFLEHSENPVDDLICQASDASCIGIVQTNSLANPDMQSAHSSPLSKLCNVQEPNLIVISMRDFSKD